MELKRHEKAVLAGLESGRTHEELARAYTVTEHRIRRIEHSALCKRAGLDPLTRDPKTGALMHTPLPR